MKKKESQSQKFGQMPTHEKDGKEIGKKRKEKIQKRFELAVKGHEKFVAAIAVSFFILCLFFTILFTGKPKVI